MKKIFLIFGLIICACTLNATTAAKGVFTVAEDKTVQFANANSVYSESELIQWAHLSDVTEEGWDVLTSDEWTYLLITRGTEKNNLGTVNGHKGLVILPDEWSQPEGTSYAATPVEYATNTYSTAQWALMADAGAVFLPCGGYSTDGETVIDGAIHGAYWAKDEYEGNAGYANCMRFNETEIHDLNHQVKTVYYSVILVRDVTVTELDEDDYAATFATKLAAADDCSFAYVRRTLKKDGTFYTLCLPFDVPDIEDSPLAGAEVFTFDGGSVSGSTGNESLHLNLSRLTGSRLTQGVPYLLRWANTGETLPKPLYFANVENWDNNTTAETEPGNETIKLRGVYPKAHIPGYTSGSVAHYNFFLGANNTLYWPDDNLYLTHDMKGFRAYFYIVHDDPAPAPNYRGMQTVWNISGGFGAATGIQNTDRFTDRVQTEKLMRDGQIVLIIDGKMYDLQGKQIK